MSLSTALDTAKSSLQAAQTQTAILSRNIANVNTVGATKKYANVITTAAGGVQVTSISQSSNTVLFRNMLDANSAVGKGNVISNGLDRLNDTIGDTELSRSPAALVTQLGDALNTLAASPNNYELARKAATAAGDLVQSLNDASLTVQTIRRDADNELVNASADMTKILSKIEELNKQVIAGTRSGADVTDVSDERDRQVLALSQYVGVTSQVRGDNDLVLYTDSGVTLFETKPRAVEYSATPGLNETVTSGNAFRIDGTAVTGENAYMPLKSGSVAGLVTLRDDVLVTYQTQLDEIARGLVASFAESDQSASPTQSDQTGLFGSTQAPVPLTLEATTFSAGSIVAGDRLTFDVQYENQTYKASAVFTATPTAAQYRAALQTAIDTAVPASGGGAAIGSGKIAVGGTGSAVTVTALGAAAYSPFGISSISASPRDATRTGGLASAAAASGSAATAATIGAGTYGPGSISAGDALAFSFTVDGTTYNATQTFATAPATAAEYQAKLQSAINAATSVPAGTALGAGRVTATVDGVNAISLTTTTAGASKSLSITSVSGNGGLATAALASGTAPQPATVAAGTYAAGPIGAGDTLSFDFTVDGKTYRATQTFTAAPASATDFQAHLQTAIDRATSVPGGAVLGADQVKIAIGGTNAISLSTVAGGATKSLSLTSVTAVAAGTADTAKTGGLVAESVAPVIIGLANTLRLGAGVAADPTKIRDGVSFDYNAGNAGGFTARLNALGTSLSATRDFSATSGADPRASIADYAASSVSWLQASRQEQLTETEYKSTLLEQTQKTLSNETGINMDEQLVKMTEIQRSFQASSKLISTIDEMMKTLLDSI